MPKAVRELRDELEDDDLEDEEEAEEEEESDPPPVVVAPPAPAPATIPTPARRAPPPKKPRATGAGMDLRPPKQSVRYEEKDIDVLWGQVIAQLESQGNTPYEAQIVVRRPGGETGWTRLGIIEGGSVLGDSVLSPGQALVRRLEDQFHLQSGEQGPVSYQCEIQWRANSQKIAVGRISLAPRNQIMAMRQQQMYEAQSQGYQQPPGMPPGMGRPMPQQPWPQPWGPPGYYPPPPQYYPPPPQVQQAAPAAQDPSVRQAIDMLTGMVNELREENARIRNQPPPPPMAAPQIPVGMGAPAAPPQAPIDMEATMERAVVKAVQMLAPALRPQQPQGLGMEQQFMQETSKMISGLFQETMGLVFKQKKKEITQGLGAPLPEMPAPEAPSAEIVEPPDPNEDLPFNPIALETKFPDGNPMIYPVNKQDGSIDWKAVVLANPYLMTQLSATANEVGKAIADGMRRMGAQGPHVVSRTPSGAQQAGVGAPPKKGNGNGESGAPAAASDGWD